MDKKGFIEKLKAIFPSKEVKDETPTVLNLASVMEINKWEIPVEDSAFAVGDVIMVTYEDGEPFTLADGQYELEDGKVIHVDIDGKIVLVEGGEEAPADDTTDMADDAPADDTTDEVTIEAIAEQLVNVAEMVADLTSRVEALEGGGDTVDTTVDTPAADDTTDMSDDTPADAPAVDTKELDALKAEMVALKAQLENTVADDTPQTVEFTSMKDLMAQRSK